MNPAVVVQCERSGPRVLLIESNYRFRATASDPQERRAELDSFARSTLWGFEVAAEEGSRVLVDATASSCETLPASQNAWLASIRGRTGSMPRVLPSICP